MRSRSFLCHLNATLLTSVGFIGSNLAFAQEAPSCGLKNGIKAIGASIPIGAIVGKTGPDDFSASASAAAAYFKCVNQNGGIHGRPIEYIVQDDQWNAEVAAQAASKLVRDRKVVAMVGSSSFVECSVNNKLYEQEDVMVIAGVGVPKECFFAKNYVPINAGPRISATIATKYAVIKYRIRSLVCIVPNIPSLGNWACEGPKQWGKLNGVTVETMPIDPSGADSTSVVLRAAASKPDAILLVLPKGIMVPILAAAEQQNLGKKIHFLSTASGYNIDVPKAIGPYWRANFDVNLEFQPLDASSFDNKNWLHIMDVYGNKADQRDTFSQAGYLAARLVIEALLKMDPTKIERHAVSNALRNVRDFKSDILCKSFYVGTGNRHNSNFMGRMASLESNRFKAITDCIAVDDPELVDIRLMEKVIGTK